MNKSEFNINGYAARMVAAGRELVELADRDTASPAYGCFSYPYWRSKTADYANARCQEAAYTLALLFKNDYPESALRGNLELMELAEAASLFWAEIQHSDGSFDEWYRGEHGFAATAFSAFAISRTLELIGEDMADSSRRKLDRALHRAGRWLIRHDDLDKINHEAVAAAALFSLAEVLHDEKYARGAREKVALVLSRQAGEGWFPELGGVDTGYSFLTLEYLAYCYSFRPTDELRDALERALEFLSFFVHPDLTTGREYNLCGNSYVSLLAASIMADFSPRARTLFLRGVERGNALIQLAQDDLSRCYHLYNGLLSFDFYRKNLEFFREEGPPLPFAGVSFSRYFPEAGLLAVKTENYYAVASGPAGGLLKVYSLLSPGREENRLFRDLGYTVLPGSGTALRSFLISRENRTQWDGNSRLRVTAAFRQASYFFPKAPARFLLRLVSALPGGYLLIKKAVDLIRRRKGASLQLTSVAGSSAGPTLNRTIVFREDSIRVEDEIEGFSPSGDSRIAARLDKSAGGLTIWKPGRDGVPAIPASAAEFRLGKTILPAVKGSDITWDSSG